MGRPKIIITDEICIEAERLAGLGLTKKQIAISLGFGYTTLNEREKEYSEFSKAIKIGQLKAIEKVANALFNNAMEGNTTAQIFFLKNRAANEWKDRVPEGSGEAQALPVSVNFTMIDGRKDADQSEPD